MFLKASAGFFIHIDFCYSTSHFITLMEREHPWAHRSPHPAWDNFGNSAPSTDTRVRWRPSDHGLRRRTTETQNKKLVIVLGVDSLKAYRISKNGASLSQRSCQLDAVMIRSCCIGWMKRTSSNMRPTMFNKENLSPNPCMRKNVSLSIFLAFCVASASTYAL